MQQWHHNLAFSRYSEGSPSEVQQPTESSKQPIITRYLGHMTGYHPITNQGPVFPDSVGSFEFTQQRIRGPAHKINCIIGNVLNVPWASIKAWRRGFYLLKNVKVHYKPILETRISYF